MNLLKRLRNIWELGKFQPRAEEELVHNGSTEQKVVLTSAEAPKKIPATIVNMEKRDVMNETLS